MVNIRYRDNQQLYSTLINIAVPIALQSIVTASLTLIDNLMIGQLGETELSAVGMANQFYFIHHMLIFGFTSGSTAFVAQFWGNRDLKNIRKVLGFALTMCFIASLLFFLASFLIPQHLIHIFSNDPDVIMNGKIYLKIVSFTFLTMGLAVPHMAVLRATEQSALPMKISILAFLTNIVLDYVLIFGKAGFPALGVKGAAIATLIARILEMSLILYFIYIKSNIISGKFSDFFSYSSNFAKHILRKAIPVVTNETLWGLGMAAYAVAYGKLGTTEYAAIQVSNTIHSLFILAIFSLGDASMVMIGKELGVKNEVKAYETASKLLVITILLGLFSGIILIIFSPAIVDLFNFTDEGKHYATIILMIYGFAMWIKVFNGVNVIGTFRSGGDTKFAMMTEVMTVWLIGVPLVFIGALILKLPVYIVVIMAHIEEVIKGLICLKRFLSKKWINNIIHGIE